MVTKFRSFGEFGKNDQELRAADFQKKMDAIFEKSIGDDFDSIPVGSFRSSLPEIDSISFVRPEDNKKGILYAVIFSKGKDGKTVSHNWAVLKNGQVYPKDRIPSELSKYDQEEVALEIAGLLERIGPSFIHLTDLDIIPDQDERGEREDSGGTDTGGGMRPIDPEREEFIRSLNGAKFMSVNRSEGLRGYVVVFFQGQSFVLIENQYKDNAAFILDLDDKVDMDVIEKELLAERTDGQDKKVTKDEIRKAVVKKYWAPISDKVKTRNDLVTMGAKRYVHTPDVWQQQIRDAITEKMQ